MHETVTRRTFFTSTFREKLSSMKSSTISVIAYPPKSFPIFPIDNLRRAAAHVVVLAMNGGTARGINPVEIDGAVLGVVVHRPDTGAGLHAGLVTIRIKSRR